jgi:hypothetical protein
MILLKKRRIEITCKGRIKKVKILSYRISSRRYAPLRVKSIVTEGGK